ncbi:enoyl-CoA hydratase/isomerase family protein [Undibacterium sp.]|jgi:2-(1,2-epoxy-1,2-dihydrophenyl)acetyl-CoA isomerase|uniref:enoyl-CoA hydratase/isomerase family protein n=1 Tax=Undibacterium sp. TaxID=1914977 RepID=UPI002C97B126|nr:enoyl-CoA hydratase-related protein [Undibacterium sp.]HTD03677.1 enoyl-CoA hydratase-related protein [Undibacterium sp.]
MATHLLKEKGLATIVFDCPASLNVLGLNEIREFNHATQEIVGDPSIRVVLIRANGPIFGAGGDLGGFQPESCNPPDVLREIGKELNPTILRLRGMPAIVVAAVHGAVAGSSMGPMNAADIVIAAKGTRFNTAYARVGASPDAGSTWFLPRIVGVRKTMELMLMSENFDADTALRYGLVNQVVPPEQLRDVTDKLVARLLHGPHETYIRMKRLIYQSCSTSLAQQLDDEIEHFAAISTTKDFEEGISAFMNKRAPHFGCQ